MSYLSVIYLRFMKKMQLSVEYRNRNGNDIEFCLAMKLGTPGFLAMSIPGK